MQFHSIRFILVFIPAVVAGYAIAGRVSMDAVKVWLILSSLVFYAASGVSALPVLAVSIIFNYGISLRLDPAKPASAVWLRIALVANVLSLAAFKYAGFFAGNVNTIFGTHWSFPDILLPLGISFFTVQQIMFLVDRHQGVLPHPRFLDYALFVSWFPYIVAGPITRWKDVIPQFVPAQLRIDNDNLARGTALFVLGLAKKVVLASAFAPWADAGFSSPAGLGFAGAWLAVFAFTFQLYFDFSGYTDMARGVALLVNIKLPENFRDPYWSLSITEFWQRWHITLTNFITTYIYTPILRIGRPTFRRAMFATVVTMTVAGAWHGASWGYVAFGLWHGVGLAVNNMWRRYGKPIPAALSWCLTAVFVLIGFALFRAHTLADGWTVIASMFAPARLGGETFDVMIAGDPPTRLLSMLIGLGLLFYPATASRVSSQSRLQARFAAALAVCTFICLVLLNSKPVQGFIYRQF